MGGERVKMQGTMPLEHEARISELLVGAVDPHVHSGPSIAPRALDHLELARELSEAGFSAVVTKDHDYSGVMCATMIAHHHPDLTTRVFSGIALNNVVGGLNPYGVEHTAAMGGKIVWLPTLAAENHLSWQATSGWSHPASTSRIRAATAVRLWDDDGKMLPELHDILDVCAATGLALASGHVHVSETKKIFAEARKRGVERLIFTHPEDIVGASMEDTREIADMGAMVEHSLAFFLEGSKFRNHTTEQLGEYIELVGPERTILCSDLGQVGTLTPLQGFRRAVSDCLSLGYDDAAVRAMVSGNAAQVIGLDR
ncbi:DUF6282 family protein [Rhodovulum sulfidophilum]|uniref:DUF6282 family protein n=1 Tax=Rhodovulum sulfidophilum TaxID=35806 RepID=UPI001F1B027E|nr:DUF6282 family protein [Rhodovulum sulfidophilum]MCE8439135.1 DUF6282 family protein [Rhodovulum sulfidophilum]